MKQLLVDERFKYWPVCSIAYFALREDILNISLSTWYYYINRLGIGRPVLLKKKAQGPGICSNRPHEIWHADIMVMKTLDGIKSYLYFLMDNYSRLIKYRYLFKQDFRDIHNLRKGLEWIVFDYNNNRPHISLRGLTPNEAATGENVPKDRWHEQIIQAQKNRLAENRKELCRICK